MHFDASSVEKLENFLCNCRKEIVDGKLWIALQANALSDQCKTDNRFNSRYVAMKRYLMNIFTFPDLSKNMRNSENINSAGQGVQQEGYGYKISDMIDKSQNSIHK